MKLNHNFDKMPRNYLFAEVARRTATFREANPDADIIRLGIGDVTRPLSRITVDAMKSACEEMAHAETFRGYPPYEGWDFLRTAVRDYYASYGVTLSVDDIFISDGAKSDCGNITDLFDDSDVIMVSDPVYPVYLDTNLMDGRNVIFSRGNAENGFLPMPDPSVSADVIYLCSPNNPTGAVYNRDQLKAWVDYARSHDAIILFDAAYEAFVRTPGLPRSIFEIEGARECAIEFCSFSKTAGFTGTRCGYTVIPSELERDGMNINRLWLRRQSTKFNGVSYPVQRAAAAVLTPEGLQQAHENIDFYRINAKLIADTMNKLGISYTGGENSPYIWLRCPLGLSSWDFFDLLLESAHVVGTPGSGFGEAGEGYFRLTAFGNRTEEAVAAIITLAENGWK